MAISRRYRRRRLIRLTIFFSPALSHFEINSLTVIAFKMGILLMGAPKDDISIRPRQGRPKRRSPDGWLTPEEPPPKRARAPHKMPPPWMKRRQLLSARFGLRLAVSLMHGRCRRSSMMLIHRGRSASFAARSQRGR